MNQWGALRGGICAATVDGEGDELDCTKSKQLTRFVGGANITIHTARRQRRLLHAHEMALCFWCCAKYRSFWQAPKKWPRDNPHQPRR